MVLPRKVRLMVRFITGLYFIAQIMGAPSLFAIHLHHTYQSEVAIADDLATTGRVDHEMSAMGTINTELLMLVISAAPCTTICRRFCRST